jgi:hypothetical protein
MTKEEFAQLPPGLYRIHVREGIIRPLLAVVGVTIEGGRWFVCANWTNNERTQPIDDTYVWVGAAATCRPNPHLFDSITSMELINPTELDYLREEVEELKRVAGDKIEEYGTTEYSVRFRSKDVSHLPFNLTCTGGDRIREFSTYGEAMEVAKVIMELRGDIASFDIISIKRKIITTQGEK